MEDYKKKYEDALERAKEMCAMPTDRATMEYVFPELKESEDEKIRKSLLNEFTHLQSKGCNKFAGLESEDIITWLKKQEEMDIEKPITIGKCKLTGKAAELAKEVTPESLEEARKKLIAEEEYWQDVRERAAIAAMEQLIEMGRDDGYKYSPSEVANYAVVYANALIEELKNIEAPEGMYNKEDKQ